MPEKGSDNVIATAIVLIMLIAVFAFYFLFGRSVSANRQINVDTSTPPP
jgi:hypothetical protein